VTLTGQCRAPIDLQQRQVDSHLPSGVQTVINTADKANDIAASAGPALDVLQATNTLASFTPIGEAGLPAVMENAAAQSFSTAAFSSRINIADNFSLNAAPAESSISPKVQEALNTLNDIKADGGTITSNSLKPNQELNMTIEHNSSKLDLRVETHDLPVKFGGQGTGSPVRHMNVDLTPGKNALPNSGHVIL
jgi:hypothetical protein